MVFKPQGQEGDAPFNMAMMFYYRINELLAAKDRAAISGDLANYYACLEAVYNNIYFQVRKEEEIKEIETLMTKALNILTAPMPPQKSVAMQAQGIAFWDARSLLVQIDRKLLVLMDRKKMVFPRIEVTQGLKALRDRMGLDNKNET